MATAAKSVGTRVTGIRIPADEKAEIQKRADEAGLSLSRYMIRAALGQLDGSSLEDRVTALEQRLDEIGLG